MVSSGLISDKTEPSQQGDVVAFSTKTINTATGAEQVLRNFDFVLLGNNEIADEIDSQLIGKTIGEAFTKLVSGDITQVITVLKVLQVVDNKKNVQGE
jgi:FKBP-type peptidyl-prolyl cis-trans isomerase (trigger factor)